MARRTRLYFDEKCMWHSGGLRMLTLPVGGWIQPPASNGHVESPDSKRRIKNLVDVSGLVDFLDVCTAPPVTDEDLRRVHATCYLHQFKSLSDSGGGELGSHAPFGAGSYDIARISAGLVKDAIASILEGHIDNAYCLSRPPGHHCLPDEPMGSCLLANIPIAIEAARVSHGISRIAVIDWDVHHGNGTQSIYYDDPGVLTISIHQDGSFPPGYGGLEDRGDGEGNGYNINIPLPPGCGHDSYLYAIQRIVLPALDRFHPEVIVVASGLDASALDPLGRMLLHSDSYREMTSAIMHCADRHCDGRTVIAHEGGYSEAYVPFCGHSILEALSEAEILVADPFLESIQPQQPREALLDFHRSMIDAMGETLDVDNTVFPCT